jgi:RNA polymerase-associated protein CTR9
LGNLYAAEVFANQSAAVKEDKSRESSKAIQYLETVRAAWKDPTKHINPDTSILICLSRLYEAESPEKSLACLKQVYDMSVDKLPESQKFEDIEDADTRKARQREFLPPQLLNNIGCFEYQLEKFENAQELFQAALTSAVKTGERDETIDTDAFITTTSFNLARTYESLGHLEDAKTVYEGLLKRHPDYTDAKTRLAFIELRQNPTVDGPKAMTDLYETDGTDLEVRALFAWYLNKSKRRAINLAEDVEQRLYKHTLQKHDKHDLYALTGMGNLNLVTAREMRRDTEAEKEKRRATYQRAVEFYQKALLLDPKNAYAAQGIAIVIADEKRDFPHAAAIFAEVKNTIRDASIYLNLGHVYAELKQYTRAIEHVSGPLRTIMLVLETNQSV